MKFVLTQSAKDKLEALFIENKHLRIAIQGGGCGGFQYALTLVAHKEKEDIEFSFGKGTVFIAKEAKVFINGATINYKKTLLGEAFEFKNPKASFSCGCGASFDM